MVTPGGLEPPAYGLGNRRSILLSYGVAKELQALIVFRFLDSNLFPLLALRAAPMVEARWAKFQTPFLHLELRPGR